MPTLTLTLIITLIPTLTLPLTGLSGAWQGLLDNYLDDDFTDSQVALGS